MCSKTLLAFFCLFARVAFAICGTGQATTFQWPLDNWIGGCNNFWSLCNTTKNPRQHHLGTDIYNNPASKTVGAAVKAPCSGLVKRAGHQGGYAGTVILECWTGTECVSPLMGHMFETDMLGYKGLQVKPGQTVTKGQIIGYIASPGNNGAEKMGEHLHFAIHKGPFIDGLACDGGWFYAGYAITDCVYNDWYDPDVFIKSHLTLPKYNFKPNGVVCKGPVTGGAETNWIYTCNNPATAFQEGDNITSLIYLSDIKVNHTYQVKTYRNGVYMWEWAGDKIYVDPVWGWNRSYFWPGLTKAQPGNWEFQFSVRADPEPNFVPLETVKFTVTGNSNGYAYNKNGLTCYGPVTGGANTNWLYTCNWPNKVFKNGDTVYGLVRLENVWVNHTFRAEFWRNGVKQWHADQYNQVDQQWGWQYSHFWPRATGIWPGNWEIRIYVDSGKGFMPLDTLPFSVL